VDGPLPAVFVGLTEVAGYFGGLAAGLRANGCRVGFLNTNSFRYAYPEPAIGNPWIFRATSRLARRLSASTSGPGSWFLRWAIYVPLKCLSFAYALATYDVFIFGGNSSFFGLRELPVYRWLRKQTVFVSLGSDSRPAYLSGIYKDDLPPGCDPSDWMVERDARVSRVLARIDAHASVVVDYPQHAHFRRRVCCSGLALGFPVAARPGDALGSAHPSSGDLPGPRAVRLLHAPSRPAAKGSHRVRGIVAALRERGLDIDYVELAGVSNAAVLREIDRADVVIDECYSDLPLGGLGVEAALLGKPVVVGGYFAERLREHLPPEDVPPSVFVPPEDVEGAVRELVEGPEKRRELGEKLRIFVTQKWSGEAVGQRYLRVLRGTAPGEWFFDPSELDYFLGWGVSHDEARQNVTRLVERHSAHALQLDHDARLRERMLAFFGLGDRPA
jgi:hypothetical protein